MEATKEIILKILERSINTTLIDQQGNVHIIMIGSEYNKLSNAIKRIQKERKSE